MTIKRIKTKFDIKLNEIKWLEMDLKKKNNLQNIK